MRVAYISSAPLISGAERNLQDILALASATGIDPLVICPASDPLNEWLVEQKIPVRNCALPVRDKWHPIKWFGGVAALTGILSREKIDIVHVNHTFCYQAAGEAARRLGIPTVCHLQNEVFQTDLEWTFSAGVDAIVSLTRYLENDLRKAWPENRIQPPEFVTLLSGMKMPPRIPPSEVQQLQSDTLSRLGIAPHGTMLGFIGMLKPIKGLAELLETLAVLRSTHPDFQWQLLVAGRDHDPGEPYLAQCREIVDRCDLQNRVHFLGFLEDTSQFYHAIDVAIAPSLIEPMGRISHEAAKFCKPTIAFASGGIPETIEERETGGFARTGWMVETNDVAALGRIITEVGPDRTLLSTVGQAARDRVEVVVDPVRHNQRLYELYDQLLSRRRSATPPLVATSSR